MSDRSSSILIRLAWRSVWRRKRRTLITVGSIAFGIALCLFFTGLSDGMYGKVTEMAVRMGAGHLTVENPEYRKEAAANLTLTASQDMLDQIESDPRVEGMSLRMAGPAMISTSHGTVGGSFDAVRPQLDQTISLLAQNLVEGDYLADERDLILGVEMARKLQASIGSKIVLTTQSRDGETVQDLFRVCGIFETRSTMLDGFYVQITLADAQQLLGVAENEVHQIGIYLFNDDDMEEVAETLSASSAFDSVVIVPWQEILRDLADYIKVDNAFNYVFQFLLFLVILAGVLNTVLMSVMERTYEFGVMLSIGMKRHILIATIVLESFFLAIIGTVTGGLLGILENIYFKSHPISFESQISDMSVGGFFIEPALYMDLSMEHVLITLAAVFVMVVLAGIYPAWKAGQVEPVQALQTI